MYFQNKIKLNVDDLVMLFNCLQIRRSYLEGMIQKEDSQFVEVNKIIRCANIITEKEIKDIASLSRKIKKEELRLRSL